MKTMKCLQLRQLVQGPRATPADKVPFIYYVSIFLGFLDPPSSLHKHILCTENKQKLPFSNSPPPKSAYVIYEWSLGQASILEDEDVTSTSVDAGEISSV